MAKPSVKINFIYSAILTTANVLFPLIVYPYVSRVLGVSNIGLCNFVDSIINYFILFSTLGMSVLGIREIAAAKSDRTQLNEIYSTLFALNAIATLVMLVALVIVTIYVPRLNENWHMMVIGGFKLVFNFLLIEWLFKGLEEFKYITTRTIIVRLVYVALVFLFIKKNTDYTLYYLFTTLMIVLNAIINVAYSRKYVTLSFKDVNLKKQFKPFVELGIYRIMTSMYTSFNVAYLGFVSTNTEVGYYSTAIKLYSILLSLFSAFTGVMLPRMSSLFAENEVSAVKKYIDKSYSFLFVFSIPVMVFSIFNADGFIALFSGKGYEGAIIPMMIVMPLILIVGSEQILIEQVLMPMKKDKAVTLNSVVGATVGVLLNIIIVPYLLSIGSAIVIGLSELTIFLLAVFEVKHYLNNGFPIRKLIKHVFAYMPLIIIEIILFRYIDNPVIRLFVNMMVFGIYFIAVNQMAIKEINCIELVKSIIHRNKNAI